MLSELKGWCSTRLGPDAAAIVVEAFELATINNPEEVDCRIQAVVDTTDDLDNFSALSLLRLNALDVVCDSIELTGVMLTDDVGVDHQVALNALLMSLITIETYESPDELLRLLEGAETHVEYVMKQAALFSGLRVHDFDNLIESVSPQSIENMVAICEEGMALKEMVEVKSVTLVEGVSVRQKLIPLLMSKVDEQDSITLYCQDMTKELQPVSSIMGLFANDLLELTCGKQIALRWCMIALVTDEDFYVGLRRLKVPMELLFPDAHDVIAINKEIQFILKELPNE